MDNLAYKTDPEIHHDVHVPFGPINIREKLIIGFA